MADMAPIDWNINNTSAQVSIGTHSLFVSTHGLPRLSSSQPVVILISGTAGTTARWPALLRDLSPYARILAYDRSGMGLSQPSPDPSLPTLDSISSDLHALLTVTNLSPPYLLLVHSWGGMLGVHFSSTFPNPSAAITGLVLLDPAAPTSSAPSGKHTSFATDPGTPWSHQCVGAITKNLDTLPLILPPSKSALTDAEYTHLIDSTTTPSHLASAAREFSALQSSYTPFHSSNFFNRSPRLLSSTPIYLIHAHAYLSFQTLYDAGTARGNGTPTEREQFQILLKTWREDMLQNQKQFLDLTEEENRRFVLAEEGTGHDVQLMDVGACVQGVRWVLERAAEIERERDGKGKPLGVEQRMTEGR